jgi:hypothetical protein
MAKNDWVLIGAAAIIIIGGYWVGEKYDYRYRIDGTMSPAKTAGQAGGFFIGSIYATLVNYSDSGFSPSTISLPKGGAVIFRNYSSKKLRVASDPYPSNDGYPTKNGCVGSTFDSCSDIPPKVSWSFIFNSPGTWSYHNELNPSEGGIVKVE